MIHFPCLSINLILFAFLFALFCFFFLFFFFYQSDSSLIPPTFTIHSLLGASSSSSHSPLPSLLARLLIENISQSKEERMRNKPLILACGLKKKNNKKIIIKGEQEKGNEQNTIIGEDDPTLPRVDENEMELIREIIKEIEKIKMW
jgi:hypothetical protein